MTQAWEAFSSGTVPPAKAVGSLEASGFVGASQAAYLSGTARLPLALHQSQARVIWVSITCLAALVV